MDDMRKAFEAWAKGYNLDLRRGKVEDEDESYIDDMTHGAFMGWQAATMAERERCIKVCDERAFAERKKKEWLRSGGATACGNDIAKG